MKITCRVVSGLFVILFHCCQQASATAGGSLDFLTPQFNGTVPTGDDTFSENISTNGAFRFGDGNVRKVYVSTNGYISMGITPTANAQNTPDGPNSVVAPYGADIDTRIAGRVHYTQVITNTSEMKTVNNFIRDEIAIPDVPGSGSFSGVRMLVAEWDRVAEYDGEKNVTSTFQCILITNDFTSYAVFIYECGGMGWGGATIGWQASRQHASVHELNGEKSREIGCKYSPTYSAVVFRLHGCDGDALACDDVKCLPETYVCNRKEECSDGTDEEQDCPDPVLYIGIGFGGIAFIFLVLFLCIFLLMLCHYRRKQKSQAIARRRIEATDPMATTTTTTTTTTTVIALGGEEDDSKPESRSSPAAAAAEVVSNNYETGRGIYPELSNGKEADSKNSCNGSPPTYYNSSTFPSVAGLQGYPAPTYPVQPALPLQQQSPHHSLTDQPPMITEDTV